MRTLVTRPPRRTAEARRERGSTDSHATRWRHKFNCLRVERLWGNQELARYLQVERGSPWRTLTVLAGTAVQHRLENEDPAFQPAPRTARVALADPVCDPTQTGAPSCSGSSPSRPNGRSAVPVTSDCSSTSSQRRSVSSCAVTRPSRSARTTTVRFYSGACLWKAALTRAYS